LVRVSLTSQGGNPAILLSTVCFCMDSSAKKNKSLHGFFLVAV
jgi:hypothetical protein